MNWESNRASNIIALLASLVAGAGLIVSIRNDQRVDSFEFKNAAMLYSPRLQGVAPLRPVALAISDDFHRRLAAGSADDLDAVLRSETSVRNTSDFPVRVLATLVSDRADNPDSIRAVLVAPWAGASAPMLSSVAKTPTAYQEIAAGDTLEIEYSALLHFTTGAQSRVLHVFTFVENPQGFLYDFCSTYSLSDSGVVVKARDWASKFGMLPGDTAPLQFDWLVLSYVASTSHSYSRAEAAAIRSRQKPRE